MTTNTHDLLAQASLLIRRAIDAEEDAVDESGDGDLRGIAAALRPIDMEIERIMVTLEIEE